jgi:SAM-dependent methyltransferase
MHKTNLNNDLLPFIPNGNILGITEVPYFWNINNIHVEKNGELRVAGWALPWGGNYNGTQIRLGGGGGDLNINFTDSKEVARRYPWWPNAIKSQFNISVPLEKNEEIYIFNSHAKGSLNSNLKSALYFMPEDLNCNFPDDVIQKRIGAMNSFQFSLTGLTLAKQFIRVVEDYSNLPFSNNKLIIDWGCGSGRVSRHIIGGLDSSQRFIGFDIDEQAISWANKNIRPYFFKSNLNPPLEIDSGSADIIYAYSVLTHLALNDMRMWINEAARVIKKDGYFIFTILGETAFIDLMPYAEHSLVSAYLAAGIYDTQENNDLNSMGVGGDYYRNVWLREDFIKSEISEYFEFLGIERNFHYYQDVVVCKRK